MKDRHSSVSSTTITIWSYPIRLLLQTIKPLRVVLLFLNINSTKRWCGTIVVESDAYILWGSKLCGFQDSSILLWLAEGEDEVAMVETSCPSKTAQRSPTTGRPQARLRAIWFVWLHNYLLYNIVNYDTGSFSTALFAVVQYCTVGTVALYIVNCSWIARIITVQIFSRRSRKVAGYWNRFKKTFYHEQHKRDWWNRHKR